MDHLVVADRADRRVLELIAQMGGDTRKTREVEFFLYLSSEEEAYKVGAELQKAGFDVQVDKGSRRDWLCFAVKKIAPTSKNLATLRRYFMSLVAPFQGQYDGWGTGVEDGTWKGKE
ncbi:MAG: ribonuclease E inhibitor RraB [Ignavibacteriales bacterium]|nr:ribonuclease E inhibitor RraB [Ignavibacteriales bacterium]